MPFHPTFRRYLEAVDRVERHFDSIPDEKNFQTGAAYLLAMDDYVQRQGEVMKEFDAARKEYLNWRQNGQP